jgi:DNA-binding CsgD family transcriptional regulator
MISGSCYLPVPTPRELEVLKLIAAGLSTKQIAVTLGISFKTASCHRSRLMDKLGIHEIAGLTRYAIRNGHIGVSVGDRESRDQEDLFQRVRVTYAEYQRALDAYATFLKHRESIGLANPDSSTGARRLRDGEKNAHEKYHSALLEFKKFLIPEPTESK